MSKPTDRKKDRLETLRKLQTRARKLMMRDVVAELVADLIDFMIEETEQ